MIVIMIPLTIIILFMPANIIMSLDINFYMPALDAQQIDKNDFS